MWCNFLWYLFPQLDHTTTFKILAKIASNGIPKCKFKIVHNFLNKGNSLQLYFSFGTILISWSDSTSVHLTLFIYFIPINNHCQEGRKYRFNEWFSVRVCRTQTFHYEKNPTL